MKARDSLAIAQINRRLTILQRVKKDSQIRGGWIHYLRTGLGMTLKDLATRLQVSTSAVAQAERNEVADKISLETLRNLASAMDCDLVYAFVPKETLPTLESILMKNANEKARQLLSRVDLHMELEGQQVQQSLDERIHQLAKKLIEKGDVW